MRLVVQTNIPGGHHLWLITNQGKIVAQSHPVHQHHGADQLLKEIVQLLGRQSMTDIHIIRGPGAFTAIRAALVVTNMLGWLRNIPVTGSVRNKLLTTADLKKIPKSKSKKFITPVRPWYGRGPNITVPKKRR